MSRRLIFWSVTSALAGFLFGFDTVVISGAEKTIQGLWNLSPKTHGLAMGAALWGTVVGSLIGGIPTDRFGRRPTLIAVGALYLVSAVWSALATDVTAFAAARLIGGLGVGISTVAAPLFISEIAPAAHRGKLAGMFQFNIVLGILVAFASNAAIARFVVGDGWRWMLGVEAVPALIYTALAWTLPESPRWLVGRGRSRDAAAVLRRSEPEIAPEEVESRIADFDRGSAGRRVDGRSLLTRRYRFAVSIAFLVAFFNQMSGINAVLYFAPRIFELTGLEQKAALLQSIGIGVTNLIFTFLGVWLIDRVGRRTLLIVGSIGYIASLGATAWAFATETYAIVPACIFAFIAAHAVGQGAVIWVLISEIFPDAVRAAGQSLGSFTHWIFAAAITSLFPTVVTSFAPSVVFAFFAGMMVLQLVWVLAMVPETKGVPLEELRV